MKQVTDMPNSMPQRRRGFTLIELLVVIAILAILVALVVGVGSYVYDEAQRKETMATLAVLDRAVKKYQEVTGQYPWDTYKSGSDEYQPLPDKKEDAWSTKGSGMALVTRLKDNPATMAIIRELPKKAWSQPEDFVKDAWAMPIRYEYNPDPDHRRGGLGGKPVVISSGGDEDWTQEDKWIRSDKQ